MRTLRYRFGSASGEADVVDGDTVVVGAGRGARDGLVIIVPWPLAA